MSTWTRLFFTFDNKILQVQVVHSTRHQFSNRKNDVWSPVWNAKWSCWVWMACDAISPKISLQTCTHISDRFEQFLAQFFNMLSWVLSTQHTRTHVRKHCQLDFCSAYVLAMCVLLLLLMSYPNFSIVFPHIYYVHVTSWSWPLLFSTLPRKQSSVINSKQSLSHWFEKPLAAQ